MAKRTTPIITYTEILARATRSIMEEIEEERRRSETLPKSDAESYFMLTTKELREKLETLKTLYRIETGVDFD